MRRIEAKDYWSGDLPTVTLYRQDIDEILAIIHGRTGSKDVSIGSGDYLFDSLDELKTEQGNLIDRLKLKAPGLQLEIDRRHVSMGGLDTPEGKQILAILRSRRRRFGFVLPGVAGLIGIASSFLLVLTLGLSTIATSRWVVLGLVPALVALTTIAWILPPKSRVFLIRRHEHQAFWARHAGDFIKAGIGLSGTVLGYVVRMLQEYYKHRP